MQVVIDTILYNSKGNKIKTCYGKYKTLSDRTNAYNDMGINLGMNLY